MKKTLKDEQKIFRHSNVQETEEELRLRINGDPSTEDQIRHVEEIKKRSDEFFEARKNGTMDAFKEKYKHLLKDSDEDEDEEL